MSNLPLEKVYVDALAPAAKQMGLAAENVVKAARFILAPFDYLAIQNDRFQQYLLRAAGKVPVENITECSPEIVGKTFEGLKYLEPDSILTEMYINLLSSSIDKERKKFAHPAIPLILSNLSRDEAIIIYFLNNSDYEITQYSELDIEKNLFKGRQLIKNSFPVNKLDFPDNFFLYIDHLYSINLAGIWQNGNQIPEIKDSVQIGVTINSKMMLTEFGKHFAQACVVDDITKFGISI